MTAIRNHLNLEGTVDIKLVTKLVTDVKKVFSKS